MTSQAFTDRSRRRQAALCVVCAGLLGMGLLAGCATDKPAKVRGPQEKFDSSETFTRLLDASPEQACEAARRALLGQGYLVTVGSPQLVEGKKSFQPEADAHIEMMIRVVCVPDTVEGKISLTFATAVQDTYTLKKTNSSASLGLGGIGSVSMPLASSSEGMTKVGSQTISSSAFYDSFFDRVRQQMATMDSMP
ncbi:MAG TPA: DUF2242 domain-containing protein [Macromonas sp.]|nr:DUF2242 domain-containing protein [Macromonas sp.]